MTMVGRSLDARPKSMLEISRQDAVAHEIPMARPMNESTRVSGRTIQRTFRRCARVAPFNRWPVRDVHPVLTGNPEAEATLQRQRGLVLTNAAVLTDAKSREFGALLPLSAQWQAFCTRSEQPRQARVQQSRKDSKVTRLE